MVAAVSSKTFDILNKHQYMSLTTYRKSGEAVSTPVWFAQKGDKLIVFTEAIAGKAKRIRNNGSVKVAPCNAMGKVSGTASAIGKARILPESEWADAQRAMVGKYGLLKQAFDLFLRIRGFKHVFIEIEPA